MSNEAITTEPDMEEFEGFLFTEADQYSETLEPEPIPEEDALAKEAEQAGAETSPEDAEEKKEILGSLDPDTGKIMIGDTELGMGATDGGWPMLVAELAEFLQSGEPGEMSFEFQDSIASFETDGFGNLTGMSLEMKEEETEMEDIPEEQELKEPDEIKDLTPFIPEAHPILEEDTEGTGIVLKQVPLFATSERTVTTIAEKVLSLMLKEEHPAVITITTQPAKTPEGKSEGAVTQKIKIMESQPATVEKTLAATNATGKERVVPSRDTTTNESSMDTPIAFDVATELIEKTEETADEDNGNNAIVQQIKGLPKVDRAQSEEAPFTAPQGDPEPTLEKSLPADNSVVLNMEPFASEDVSAKSQPVEIIQSRISNQEVIYADTDQEVSAETPAPVELAHKPILSEFKNTISAFTENKNSVVMLEKTSFDESFEIQGVEVEEIEPPNNVERFPVEVEKIFSLDRVKTEVKNRPVIERESNSQTPKVLLPTVTTKRSVVTIESLTASVARGKETIEKNSAASRVQETPRATGTKKVLQFSRPLRAEVSVQASNKKNHDQPDRKTTAPVQNTRSSTIQKPASVANIAELLHRLSPPPTTPQEEITNQTQNRNSRVLAHAA